MCGEDKKKVERIVVDPDNEGVGDIIEVDDDCCADVVDVLETKDNDHGGVEIDLRRRD